MKYKKLEISVKEFDEKDVLCYSIDGEENGEDDIFTPRNQGFSR